MTDRLSPEEIDAIIRASTAKLSELFDGDSQGAGYIAAIFGHVVRKKAAQGRDTLDDVRETMRQCARLAAGWRQGNKAVRVQVMKLAASATK